MWGEFDFGVDERSADPATTAPVCDASTRRRPPLVCDAPLRPGEGVDEVRNAA
jgi:hypothetical protein